jgi:hypothetical protein
LTGGIKIIIKRGFVTMDRKLLVLLAVVFFGVGLIVSAADGASDVKKADPAVKEMKADKSADAVKASEVKKDESQTGCSTLKTTLLYISNRMLDLLDIVTVDIGAGAVCGVEAKATHWMQFGGMYGDQYFLGKDYARQLGGGYASGWNYEFICLTSERRYVDETFGTTKEFILKKKSLGPSMPKDDFTYTQDIRDFWEIGANLGWIITLNVAIHPIEIADFFAGFAMIDLKGDDYGSAACPEKAKDEKK